MIEAHWVQFTFNIIDGGVIVVFFHGTRMFWHDKQNFANTVMNRLILSSFKGGFTPKSSTRFTVTKKKHKNAIFQEYIIVICYSPKLEIIWQNQKKQKLQNFNVKSIRRFSTEEEPQLEGSQTHENLKQAFAGESQANRRYLYFAQKADIEGLPDIARVFRDTGDGETGHANGHLYFLEQVGDPVTGHPIGNSKQNLQSAIVGETHEYTDMYPGFAKVAREEGFEEIAEWFETLAAAEKSHAGRFQKALKELD